jgi:SH3 domain protein
MLNLRTITQLFSFVLLFTFTHLIYAEVMYVSDQLSINMRTDKGVGFRIIKVLTSGSKLKVINVDKSGYTQVQTESGTTGWVLSRFLSKEPIARSQLKKAQDIANKLEKEKISLVNELNNLIKDNKQLENTKISLQKKNHSFSTELNKLRKISARPLQLEKENEKLRNELLSNESKTQLLQLELQSLKDDSEKQWFITGAVILFGGILLGLILPKLRSNHQRKQNWNRL